MTTFKVIKQFVTQLIPTSSVNNSKSNNNWPALPSATKPAALKKVTLEKGAILHCWPNGDSYKCTREGSGEVQPNIIILKQDIGENIEEVQQGGKRRKTRKQVKGRKTRKQVKGRKQRK